ncbi:ribosome small subunit-dependent GTPase A [Malacoplasma penetrans]|uniref:Small ribosomal subunit biogenesis GTPase RsgA n=1 Tax=Malacoplasma penetrans (strain HF-2) TaxID=272633 RepID=RSGA_MALP2|nr:ribosome small subunit-dependent GTPase A [Malacoplasma penetrans]Q8EUL6.1 RecName: Full=Small ribosomal subunit biogenesis GTPase RsgA [Malacoplasma penetrans HF-2]RXY97109.1 ribosome small subunit-dependent GTPase A [Malacoplasma penetrans]BAC44696.1 conserved hypothetical protein [Malacoplasma penetrans HF-2]
MNAKILFKIANSFLLYDLSTKSQFNAVIRKKLKQEDRIITVGDNVEFVKDQYEYVIEKIDERKNLLIRPKVANIDTLIIVNSVKEPDFSSYGLNKFLAFYEARNINNVIIYFSKMDLLNKQESKNMNQIISQYEQNGYIVLNSLDKEKNKEKILNMIKNNVVCFAGQSGVGKSTLINFLIPDLELRTQEISQALNRGKHTTTSSLMIPFNEGFVIDTPGFGSLDLNMTQLELANSFTDFRNNSVHCKFKNCLHTNEQNCFIKKMVDENKIYKQRYLDYLKMFSEIKK